MEKLSSQVLEARRKKAIGLRKKGVKNNEVAKLVGLAPQTISTYYAKYKREGKEALKSKRRGRPKGAGRFFTEEQVKEIFSLLLDQKQQEFYNALWTRESIQELIKSELKIDIPTSTMGDYLRRWELVAIKPKKRPEDIEDIEAGAWLSMKHGWIKKDAEKNNAYIWWIFLSTAKEKESKINLITVSTHTGKAKFYLYEKDLNMDTVIDFMKKTRESSDKKVYVIVESQQLNKREENLMREWDETFKEEGRIFFVPYAKKRKTEKITQNEIDKNHKIIAEAFGRKL